MFTIYVINSVSCLLVLRWIDPDYTYGLEYSWRVKRLAKIKKAWVDIGVSNDAVKKICSAILLREMGNGLQLMKVPRILRLCDGQELISADYSENVVPYLALMDVLNLPYGCDLTGAHLFKSFSKKVRGLLCKSQRKDNKKVFS